MHSIRMFVNGQAMSGGSINHGLAEATFLGECRTSPKYKFFSVRDEFPGLHEVGEGGNSIKGELYETTLTNMRQRLLPLEPLELELSVIELEDGTGSLAMIMRHEWLDQPNVTDISKFEGWRSFQATEGGR